VSGWRLIAVGRLRSGPEAELFARYNGRLRPPLAVTEIAEARGAPPEIRRREAERLLAALPSDALAVVLDLGGRSADSEHFAALLEQWRALARPLCFLIGGAEGLDRSVIARGDEVLALGPMTWPHFMVRPMLAEQLYRAQAIAAGHPYHRNARS